MEVLFRKYGLVEVNDIKVFKIVEIDVLSENGLATAGPNRGLVCNEETLSKFKFMFSS